MLSTACYNFDVVSDALWAVANALIPAAAIILSAGMIVGVASWGMLRLVSFFKMSAGQEREEAVGAMDGDSADAFGRTGWNEDGSANWEYWYNQVALDEEYGSDYQARLNETLAEMDKE